MTTHDALFLKPNVQVEPLIDSWYAWAYLIPPASAARNITERHMKIMDSYINAPQVHATAVKNPQMRGGPFVDYDGRRVDEIRALRDRTRKERSRLFELSQALGSLDAMLRQSAKGYSMQPLYQSIPPLLRGFVELVYDLNNHPSFRIIEPLMYRSSYYDRSQQSLMLSLTKGDDRPFVLSTPRLDSADAVHCHIPFDSEIVDTLFRLKSTPLSWMKIKQLLPVPPEKEEALRSFFISDSPRPYVPYTGHGIRWRYFGHACILVETARTSILVDPVLSYTYESELSRYTYLDLPDKIDYVLITHNHQDHVLFETLLQLRHKIGTIIVPRNGNGQLQDPSLKLLLKNCGFNNVIEISEMEELADGPVRITALPFFGEHADLNILTKTGWLIQIAARSLLFLADSCNVEPELYREIHNATGDVDALFLGMECDGAPLSWLYGPLLTQPLERAMDQSRRLAGSNCQQGLDIIERFNCKEVYVYAMGQEPWLNYISSIKYTEESRPIVESNLLVKRCQEKGLVSERLFGEKEILVEASSRGYGVAS